MSYIHLTTFERGQIECLYGLWWSMRAIAKKLERSHSTVLKEVQRNRKADNYYSVTAHEQYLKHRKDCKPKGKWAQSLGKLIEEKLKKHGLQSRL